MYIVLKIPRKEAKKRFLRFFSEVFWPRPSKPYGHTLILFQMKDLMVIHIDGKFHQDSISGYKVINFPMFLWRCSSHEMGPFWEFLDLFTPKYDSNLLKFAPEVVHHKTKTMCEQCFKIRCLSTNGTYPKFSVLVQFWSIFGPNLPPENEKYYEKPKFSQKHLKN